MYNDSSMSSSSLVYSTTTANTSIILQSKNIKHMTRGILNYIKITPYCINPNTQKTLNYGPQFSQQFVLPIGKIRVPDLKYPINNTIWHNKNFRILVQLPTDDDSDVLKSYIDNNTYTYKDIELIINNITYKYSTHSYMFSVEQLQGYQLKIGINPSLIANFPDTNKYEIKLRVQKNYFVNIWSEYTSTVTLYIEPIIQQNLPKDSYIFIKHYQYIQTNSVRLYNVYPIIDLNKENVEQKQYDTILAKRFQGIYDTILGIQSSVNSWAKYDSSRSAVKFNQTINLLNNKIKRSVIILEDSGTNTIPTVDNYFNSLVYCMNQLY